MAASTRPTSGTATPPHGDLCYARTIKLDHGFIGRASLEQLAGQPHRKKVFLRWNNDDIARAIGRQPARRPPTAEVHHLAVTAYDKVVAGDRTVGISSWMAYTTNIGSICAVSIIDGDGAVDGREVTVIWGETDGGTAKPLVERHAQTEIRATISTTPLI